MNRTVVALLALALIGIPRLARAQLDAAQWREDLQYLARELPARHEHMFDNVSRTVFESAARRLEERIPSLTRAEITVELARLVAMVRDGHTRLVEVSGPHALGWHRYPVRLAIFDDGVFIDAATAADKDVIGARVTTIGSMAIDDAIRAVDPFIPQDNPMTARSRAPGYLVIPEILVAAGVATDGNAITLGVERHGRAREVRVTARGAADRFEWIDMRDALRVRPLWMTYPGDRYWFEYLADTRTAYVQFNNIADKGDEPLTAFWDRVFATIDREPVDRLVLDLRQNGGGDNTLNLPLIHHVIRCRKLDAPGKLFAIIGRRTFSAAVALAADLEKHTPVVFVGEPTGGHPNRYTDTGRMVLPNSKLPISYSPFFWPYTYPGDRRSWIAPHVAIDVTSGDYAAGRDPAMDAILRYRPQPPLADQLMTVATASGLDAALTRLTEWQADRTHRYLDTEWEMHLFGRRLMVRGMLKDAIRVFEANAGAHPASYRAFEDLGTALEKAGDFQTAATHYRRSLELNPANLEPADGLERIAKSGGLPK